VQIADPNWPCAAISVKTGIPVLIINIPKFSKLMESEKVAVAAHEFGHLTLGHLSSRTFKDQNHVIIAYAHDIALNEGLASNHRLPPWFLRASTFGLKAGLSSSQYALLLKDMKKSQFKKIKELPNIDYNNYDERLYKKIVKSLIDKVDL
jgi:hypothetical protein